MCSTWALQAVYFLASFLDERKWPKFLPWKFHSTFVSLVSFPEKKQKNGKLISMLNGILCGWNDYGSLKEIYTYLKDMLLKYVEIH